MLEDFDLEAQRRELERLQQIRLDRLVVEGLQSHVLGSASQEGEDEEKDFVTSTASYSGHERPETLGQSRAVDVEVDVDMDEQLALRMASEERHSPTLSLSNPLQLTAWGSAQTDRETGQR